MKQLRISSPAPAAAPAVEHPLLALLTADPQRRAGVPGLPSGEEDWYAVADKVASGLLQALDRLEVKHGANADQLGLAVATVLGAVLVGHSWSPAAAKETMARLVPVITDLIDSEALNDGLEASPMN